MVYHNIQFKPHANGTDIIVVCSCKYEDKARSQTDAMKLARVHVEGERKKAAASEGEL